MSEPLRKFEKPEIVTYQRDELVPETVFTGEPQSPRSSRKLKRHFRSVSAKAALARLMRLL